MGSISNYFTSYSSRIYGRCAFLCNQTKDTCGEAGRRALNKMSCWGAYLGYKTGNHRLLNAMLEFRSGVPMEKSGITDLHLAASLGTDADVKAAIDQGNDIHAKTWEDWTPLHFSAQMGQGIELLLSEGADVEAKDNMGCTPLHIAAAENCRKAIDALLKAGANIEAKDEVERTPLYIAVLTENKESIRALVAKGADIFAKHLGGIDSNRLAFEKGRMEIASLLHKAEGHPAFSSEKTLHAYFENLFPPSRNRLPKDLKWLEKMKAHLDKGKDPYEELSPLFEQYKPISFEDNAKILQELQRDSSAPPSLDAVLNCLIQNSPLFVKACELANRDQKLGVFDMLRASDKIPEAFCDSDKHTIYIASDLDMYGKASALIFETLNATQRNRYQKLRQLAQAGILSREEFAILTEYCEYDTALWHNRIIGENHPLKRFRNFAENWRCQNRQGSIPDRSNPLSHTDFYRYQWDRTCGFEYLKKHPIRKS